MTDPLGLIGDSSPVQPRPPAAPRAAGADQAPHVSFKKVLLDNIEQVNQLQQDAQMAIEDLVAGRRDDLDGVLIAKQKADIAFQTLLQVRNKLMDAYEEVKQMRV
jgi:flagellar hook-basal body complex protein FliE